MPDTAPVMIEYVSKNFEGKRLSIWLYPERDSLLTEFAKVRLKQGYMTDSEKAYAAQGVYQFAFARAAVYMADSEEMAQRLYDYASKQWFMFATPILANAGTNSGDLVSCFLNNVEDSRDAILKHYTENGWLSSKGGGIAGSWSQLRPIGSPISRGGESTGIIPFIKVTEDLMMAFNQGKTRRGAYAAYLHISHPEIQEFIQIRSKAGDDARRCRTTGFHHAVVIPDSFMQQLEDQLLSGASEATWPLVDPATGQTVAMAKPKELWRAILTARSGSGGEPYIMFEDTVYRAAPEQQKALGLSFPQSNLCSEITLPTGRDHLGNQRTAVCVLSSVNLETYDDWKDDKQFVGDLVRMLDNAITDFTNKNGIVERVESDFDISHGSTETLVVHRDKNAPLYNAAYSAYRERSIGIGAMGFHAYLQKKGIAFEGVMAQVMNKRIFSHIYTEADLASRALGVERGVAPDWAEGQRRMGKTDVQGRRNMHLLAIAPNASSADVVGTSPGIEPYPANCFNKKTKDGTLHVRNRHLRKVLRAHDKDTQEVWMDILAHGGSVQHLDFLSDQEKGVFKTVFEIDQAWVIEHAADRQAFIDQSQSLNLFYDPGAPGAGIKMHNDHMRAWKSGVKTLYYLRSKEAESAETVSKQAVQSRMIDYSSQADASSCLACEG